MKTDEEQLQEAISQKEGPPAEAAFDALNSLSMGIDASVSINQLPEEIFYFIFIHLSLKELGALEQVDKGWPNRIRNVELIKKRRADQLSFRKRSLWEYIRTNDEKFIAALIQEHLVDFKIPEELESQFINLTSFCSHIQNIMFFPQYYPAYRQKLTADYFLQQIALIRATMEELDPAKGFTNLADWIAEYPVKSLEVEAVCHAYKDLEGVIATMTFLVRSLKSSGREGSPRLLNTICNPQVNRWLTGESLIFLDIYFFRLLHQMLEISVALHTFMQRTQASTDQETLDKRKRYALWREAIDNLLSRLTPSDWLAFLTNDEIDEGFLRTRITFKALQTEHPMVPTKIFSDVPLLLELANQEKPLAEDTGKSDTQLLATHLDEEIAKNHTRESRAQEANHPQIHSPQPIMNTSGPQNIRSQSTLRQGIKWGSLLKLGLAFLIALIDIGLIIAGAGVIVTLPIIPAALLITIGAVSLLAMAGAGIYNLVSDCCQPSGAKKTRHRPDSKAASKTNASGHTPILQSLGYDPSATDKGVSQGAKQPNFTDSHDLQLYHDELLLDLKTAERGRIPLQNDEIPAIQPAIPMEYHSSTLTSTL